MYHNAVILANGDYPAHPHPLEILRTADFRIACDGAAVSLLEHGIIPDRIAGDFDSLPPALLRQYADRLVHESEQETNDLSKAFRCALRHIAPSDSLTVLGATGKREDHTLGNISLLADFAGLHENIRLVTDTGIFFPLLRSGSFQTVPGQQISIFNPAGQTMKISGSGFKYPIRDLELRSWWTATLNTAEGNVCSLEFEQGSLLVFTAYPA